MLHYLWEAGAWKTVLTSHVATDNPGPKTLQAVQGRWTKCGRGRRSLWKERNLFRVASEIWHRAAENQLTDWWNHSILRGSRVFIEFLWPCISFPSIFSEHWFWKPSQRLTQVAESCLWPFLLVLDLFAIICWLVRTKGCHHIIFPLWDVAVLALCATHVTPSLANPVLRTAESFWTLRSQLLQVSLPTFQGYLWLFQCQSALAGHLQELEFFLPLQIRLYYPQVSQWLCSSHPFEMLTFYECRLLACQLAHSPWIIFSLILIFWPVFMTISIYHSQSRHIYSPTASKSSNYRRGLNHYWFLLILSSGVPGMQKYFSWLSLIFSATYPGSLSQMVHNFNVDAFSKQHFNSACNLRLP